MGKAVDGRPVDEVVDGELVILCCELVRRVADPSRPWEQQLPRGHLRPCNRRR